MSSDDNGVLRALFSTIGFIDLPELRSLAVARCDLAAAGACGLPEIKFEAEAIARSGGWMCVGKPDRGAAAAAAAALAAEEFSFNGDVRAC